MAKIEGKKKRSEAYLKSNRLYPNGRSNSSGREEKLKIVWSLHVYRSTWMTNRKGRYIAIKKKKNESENKKKMEQEKEKKKSVPTWTQSKIVFVSGVKLWSTLGVSCQAVKSAEVGAWFPKRSPPPPSLFCYILSFYFSILFGFILFYFYFFVGREDVCAFVCVCVCVREGGERAEEGMFFFYFFWLFLAVGRKADSQTKHLYIYMFHS